MLRITVVEVWLPLLPPVPMSMGMKDTSIGKVDIAPSKWVMSAPDTIAETISTISHIMRLLNMVKTGVLRYVSSLGTIPAIFSKSSVASS